jgi:hypothetical protein
LPCPILIVTFALIFLIGSDGVEGESNGSSKGNVSSDDDSHDFDQGEESASLEEDGASEESGSEGIVPQPKAKRSRIGKDDKETFVKAPSVLHL